MKILTIRLKNLASIEGEFAVDFTAEPLLSAGIFTISGATGSGKSTLLDALCLALYDRTPRFSTSTESLLLNDVGDARINQTDVRNILRRGTAEGYAEVDFLGIDGHRYSARWSVRRARNKPTLALQAQVMQVTDLESGEPLQGTKTELLARLTALTGLTYEQFTRTVLLAQNDFATFLKSKESAKAELLEKLTGTEIYSAISREIYQQSKAADAEWNRLKEQISLIELLPEAEVKLLQESRAQLIAQKEQGAKQLTELRQQAEILGSLKAQEGELAKTNQLVALAKTQQEGALATVEGQQKELALFQEQCEALKPDLLRARELDVLIAAGKEAVRQTEGKLANQQGQLDRLKAEAKGKEQEVTQQLRLLSSICNRQEQQPDYLLFEDEHQRKSSELAGQKQANEARAAQLKALNIQAVSEQHSRLTTQQGALLNMKEQLAAWRGVQEEIGKADQFMVGLKEKAIKLNEEQAALKGQLPVARERAQTLQQVCENLRLAVSRDVQALRGTLKEAEACPVCGSEHHPYAQREGSVEEVYNKVETEYREAVKIHQELNNRQIVLMSDSEHLAAQQQQERLRLEELQRREVALRPPEREGQAIDDQLAALALQLAAVKRQLADYQQLYGEWERFEQQTSLLRLQLERLQREMEGYRMLLQQQQAINGQVVLVDSVWKEESLLAERVRKEYDRLMQERSGLLRGRGVDEAERAVRSREQELIALLEAARKESEACNNRLSGLQGEVKQLEIAVQRLLAQKELIKEPERLPERMEEQQQQNQTLEQQCSAVELRLMRQKESREQVSRIEKELAGKQQTAEQWGKLNKLFGSADGTKFKIIAQSYTLNLLLLHANHHLGYLSNRYKLQQVPDTLALQVIDCDMCDEVRTVYSLSGGESFLISLALALGLSSLSSNNLKVESLFIDEGFGSLDSDSLRTAMEALEQLQLQGRKIGVISHVQEMSERIAIRIKIEKQTNGKSTIKIDG
jgi:exonuclease SbcC